MYSTIQLHSNPIIAYGQLMIWLLLKPSAWREYVKNIDPTLLPVLTLSCFSPSLRHPPPLERLCHLMRVIQPLMVGLGIALLMTLFWLIGGPVKFIDVIYGVCTGVMLSLIASGFGSFAVSLPFGLLFGGVGGILVGTGFGIGISYDNFDFWVLPVTVFSIGLAGDVTIALHKEPHQRTMGWQIGSFVLGVIVGLFALTVILMVGAYGLGDQLLYPELQQFLGYLKGLYKAEEVPATIAIINKLATPNTLEMSSQYIAIAFSAGLFSGWFLKGWRVGLSLGLFMGILMAFLNVMAYGVFDMLESNTLIKRLLSGSSRGLLYGMTFVILFTIPYLLAQRIANKWAGIVAGILGYVVIYLAIRLNVGDLILIPTLLANRFAIYSFAGFVFGITYQFWLPLVLYPFEAAMNLVIYRLQEKYSPETLLPWHPAFWDEHQPWRQWGLETWLINVAKPDTALGQQVLRQLSQGRQRWAVRAMQIEFDMQQLEPCQTVYDIAKVHEKLMSSSDLTGPNDTRLNRFVKHSRDVEGALKQLSSYEQSAGLKTVEARLEEFLVGINGRVEMQRFREIASRWRDILTDYADKLLTVKIETPYVVGQPLDERNQRVFVPRTEVSHQLRESLLSPNCPPLLLYGQRRTGKTSLLKYLNLSQLLPNYILAFIDCQGVLNELINYVSFFYKLGSEIGDAIQARYPHSQVPALTRERLHEDPFTSFDEWLDEIKPALQGKSLLLALDEFVILEEYFQKGRLERASLLGKFRNIIQHRPWIRLLFSGTHSFEELQHWASYFIQVRTLHLGYLTEEEAHKLVTRPVENFLLNYTSEASQHVLYLTHRHPALIQMLCDEIVNLKNTQSIAERLKVQLSDVEAAVPKILKLSQFLFIEIAEKQVDANALKVLQFMATQGENAVVSHLSLQSLYTSESELQTAVTQLLRRELIEEGEGGYRFQIELLRRWFTRTR